MSEQKKTHPIPKKTQSGSFGEWRKKNPKSYHASQLKYHQRKLAELESNSKEAKGE